MVRWRGMRRSQNVDDIRGAGGGGGMPLRLGMKGGGGIGIVLLLVVMYFIAGPEAVMQILSGGGITTSSVDSPDGSAPRGAGVSDEAGEFVATMLGSTEDAWTDIFSASGEQYVPPRLTIFSDAVSTACGYNSSAVGPFYCPPDQRVYLDTSFFSDLARMGGPGDFAQAYVIGHEVGHHVQNLLGTANQVRAMQQRGGQSEANRLQVLMELQADCYAGVWANHANRTHQFLEPGDVDEGLAAAAAIGDDRMQKNAGRAVTPESFTHGTSQQRKQWLETGLETGDPNACNTFGS
jgi:predicted metalloprotease